MIASVLAFQRSPLSTLSGMKSPLLSSPDLSSCLLGLPSLSVDPCPSTLGIALLPFVSRSTSDTGLLYVTSSQCGVGCSGRITGQGTVSNSWSERLPGPHQPRGPLSHPNRILRSTYRNAELLTSLPVYCLSASLMLEIACLFCKPLCR